MYVHRWIILFFYIYIGQRLHSSKFSKLNVKNVGTIWDLIHYSYHRQTILLVKLNVYSNRRMIFLWLLIIRGSIWFYFSVQRPSQVQGVQKILCFFTIYCNLSLAYIAVREFQSSQRNVRVQSLLLAGNILYNQQQSSSGEGEVANFREFLEKNTIFNEHSVAYPLVCMFDIVHSSYLQLTA